MLIVEAKPGNENVLESQSIWHLFSFHEKVCGFPSFGRRNISSCASVELRHFSLSNMQPILLAGVFGGSFVQWLWNLFMRPSYVAPPCPGCRHGVQADQIWVRHTFPFKTAAFPLCSRIKEARLCLNYHRTLPKTYPLQVWETAPSPSIKVNNMAAATDKVG